MSAANVPDGMHGLDCASCNSQCKRTIEHLINPKCLTVQRLGSCVMQPSVYADSLHQYTEHFTVWLCSHSGAALWMSLGSETHAASADVTNASRHGTSPLKADMPEHNGQPASLLPKGEMKAEAPADSLSGQAAVTATDISMDEAPPLAGVRLLDSDEPGYSAHLGVAEHNTVIKEGHSEPDESAGISLRILLVAGSHLKIWMSRFETVCSCCCPSSAYILCIYIVHICLNV